MLKRITLKNLLFSSALSINYFYIIVGASLYSYEWSSTFIKMLKILLILLLAMQWLITERISFSRFVTLAFLFTLTCIGVIPGGYETIVITVFFIFSARNIDFEIILKLLAVNILLWSGVVILSCLAGRIDDYVYPHLVGSGRVVAHSLGFKHYISLGTMGLTITFIWLYFKKKISIIESAIIILLSYLFYKVHTNRLTFLLSVALVCLCYFFNKKNKFPFSSRMWKIISIILPAFNYVFTLILLLLYKNNFFSFNSNFLSTIASRLSSSLKAIDLYGIGLFGEKIIQYGITKTYYGNAVTDFYVDSGYVFSLIGYGILFSLVLIFLYSKLYKYIWNKKNTILYIYLGLILMASLVNDFLLDVSINPILFLIPKALWNKENGIKLKEI